MKKTNKAEFSQGTITIEGTTDSIDISYWEHEDRNGQLFAELNDLILHSAQLLDLSQQLEQAEQKLAKGRAWYGRMAGMNTLLTEAISPLPESTEDNK